MTNSGEIINLIIRDESIHGVYVGLLAQSIYQSFSTEKQSEMFAWTQDFLDALMKNEKKYTKQLYDAIGLTDEVNAFAAGCASTSGNSERNPVDSSEAARARVPSALSRSICRGLHICRKTRNNSIKSLTG